MKKCEYCAKEISYFEQYCDDDCHYKANKFYELYENYGKLFAVINGICVFGIPIGLFLLSFVKFMGLSITLASCIILGIMLIILPFPTDSMISKFKIKKAMKITRLVGLALIIFGMIVTIFALFVL